MTKHYQYGAVREEGEVMKRDIIEDWLAQLQFHPIPIKDTEKLKMAFFFFKIPFQLGFAVQNWSIKKMHSHEIQR